MATLRTDLPFPTQPWEAARDRFLQGLSQEEQDRFKNATLENIFYEASAAQKKHARGSTSWIMQERLGSLVDGIDEYGKALDVYSNAYGLVLCPIWGSLRVILHIVREASKFQEKLVDMLSRIGEVLPRFRIYQTLFRRHERLLSTLSLAYLDILDFCVRTKNFFIHAKSKRIPLSIVFMATWKPFQQNFEVSMVKFRKHRKMVEKEAGLAHMIETARTREIEFANRAIQERNAKAQKKFQMMLTLPTVDYLAKHSKMTSVRHPGTNLWIQEHPDYKAWLRSSASDLLCCYGIPGSGKSVLTASIIETLRSSSVDATSFLCYYYCDYGDVLSLEPTRLIASLIKQALVQLPLDRFNDDLNSPFDGQSQESHLAATDFLVTLLQDFSTVYIVLDGLDELTTENQAILLRIVERLLSLAKPTIKFFVTTRTEELLIRKALRPHKNFDIATHHLSKDISLVVHETVESILLDRHPNLNTTLKLEIVEALVKGANGMFLWVKFQLLDICEALTEASIRLILHNLPRSLGETYARIIQKIYASHGGDIKLHTVERVFRWVVCARRPLHIKELEEAIGLEKTDKMLHTERTALHAGDRLISACGNLISYNRNDDTVSLAHHTVQQFLCSSRPEENVSYPSTIHFDMVQADTEIGEICVAYLSFSDFETQLVRRPITIPREEAEQLVWHRVPFSTAIRALTSRVSRSGQQAQAEYAMPVLKRMSPVLANKFLLLEYVIESWVFHASRFTATKSACWTTFVNVTLFRQLEFEFRPWNNQTFLDSLEEPEVYQYPWKPLYSWAMKHGARSVLELLSTDATIANQFTQYFHKKYFNGKYLGAPGSYLLGEDFLHCLLHTEWQSSSRNFFDGHLIYQLQADYPDLPYHVFEGLGFLSVLTRELCHCLSNAQVDSLFEQALLVAAERNDQCVLRMLRKSQVTSVEQLSRIIVQSINHGIRGSSLLCLLLNPEPSSQRFYDSSYDLQFVYALNSCLSGLISLLAKREILVSDIEPSYRHLLLVLALSQMDTNINGVQKLLEYQSPHISQPVLFKNLGWRTGDTAEDQIISELCTLSEKRPIAIALKALSRIHMHDESSGYIELFNIILEPDLYSPVYELESRGFHCLEWAAQAGLSSVVRHLLPRYTDYIRDFSNIEGSAAALRCGMVSNFDTQEAMMEWEWPDFVIRKAANAH